MITMNNTQIESKENVYSVRLYATVVYSETPKEIVLNTGGWNTLTTARRIDQCLRARGIGGTITRKKGTFHYNSQPFVNDQFIISKGDN